MEAANLGVLGEPCARGVDAGEAGGDGHALATEAQEALWLEQEGRGKGDAVVARAGAERIGAAVASAFCGDVGQEIIPSRECAAGAGDSGERERGAKGIGRRSGAAKIADRAKGKVRAARIGAGEVSVADARDRRQQKIADLDAVLTGGGVDFGETYPLFGAALGAVWGILLEFDEGVGGGKDKAAKAAKPADAPKPKA